MQDTPVTSSVQLNSDIHWMQLALQQAKSAAESGEVPVGAVIVRNGALLSASGNTPIGSHDPTAHAEVLALRHAAHQLENYRLHDCELFVTLEPCMMCAGAILQARIKRVVFGAHDPKTGAAGSVLNAFALSSLNHQTTVQGGLLADDCSALLHQFFERQRARHQHLKSQTGRALRDDALRTPESCFVDLPQSPLPSSYVVDLPSLAGLRMHFLDSGFVGSDQAMLFLHDWHGWSQAWHEAINKENPQLTRLICPDLIGFGKSDKPKRSKVHTVEWHAEIVHELMCHLALPKVILIAPETMKTLVAALVRLGHHAGLTYRWVSVPDLDQYAARAPFPDAGHEAALRAFSDAANNESEP